MCGIVGVIVKDHEASYLAAELLKYVQHRGQDAAGLYSVDRKGTGCVRKDIGHVEAVFTAESDPITDSATKLISPIQKIPLSSLEGRIAIGHVRYKTIGRAGKMNAQPFCEINSDGNPIGLCHNGHIANYSQLENHFLLQKNALVSDCDAEPILKLFARELEGDITPQTIFSAAGRTMDQLVGSYSACSAVHDQKSGNQYLVIFRDPHAIRPCVIGRSENAFAAASESMTLEVNGFFDIHDVEPGEVVIADKELNICKRTVRKRQRKHCFFEGEYFARASAIMDGIRINELRYQLGKRLARDNPELAEKYDIVVYVPNTAIPASRAFVKAFAEELHKPSFEIGIEKYPFSGRSFIDPDINKRNQDTPKNHYVYREIVQDKRTLLFDDSIVKGPTSRALIKLVRYNGAPRVGFCSTTPPIRFHCSYGIVMDENLIAPGKTIEQIREYIGADDLVYMTIEGLRQVYGNFTSVMRDKAIRIGLFNPCINKKLSADDFCYACITGEQPIDITRLPELR